MTISMATIIYIATCIGVIGAAVKVLMEAKKSLLKPLDDINTKLNEHEKYLENAQRKITKSKPIISCWSNPLFVDLSANVDFLEFFFCENIAIDVIDCCICIGEIICFKIGRIKSIASFFCPIKFVDDGLLCVDVLAVVD